MSPDSDLLPKLVVTIIIYMSTNLSNLKTIIMPSTMNYCNQKKQFRTKLVLEKSSFINFFFFFYYN